MVEGVSTGLDVFRTVRYPPVVGRAGFEGLFSNMRINPLLCLLTTDLTN